MGAGRDFTLVCEHASAYMPAAFSNLGLDEEARLSHIAWDPGARALAIALAHRLSAKLVAGCVSRLIYDCNRPLEAPDSIVAQGDSVAVPGNTGLSEADRRWRHRQVHEPFHAAVSEALDAAGRSTCLVTIHSFTKVFRGQTRAVEIGYLWDADDRMGQAALAAERALGRRKAEANEPYSAADGVTYSLAKHGVARGIPNVMIEVRSDLLETKDQIDALADDLATVLQTARREVMA